MIKRFIARDWFHDNIGLIVKLQPNRNAQIGVLQ